MRLLYGVKPVEEALKSSRSLQGAGKGSGKGAELYILQNKKGADVDAITQAAKRKKVRVREVSKNELDKLCDKGTHQGIALVTGKDYPYVELEDIISKWKGSGSPALILVLDSIEDPRNLGALIRSANAAGVHGVVIPKDRSSHITPVVVKASAGATEHTDVAMVTNLTQALKRLKEAGVWTVGIEAEGKSDIYSTDLSGDVAIVVGSEGKGIRRLVSKECDFLLNIPMKGEVNSLNASVAGAVVLFEVLRQQGGKGL